MYQYEEDVMSSWEATKLYRQGKLEEEELIRIRKINKQKYGKTEKGKIAQQRAYENFKNKENYKEKLKEYRTKYYMKHHDEILKRKRRKQFENKEILQ